MLDIKNAKFNVHFKHSNLPLWQNAHIKRYFKITVNFTGKTQKNPKCTLYLEITF
jgi:hypothetical protein